MYYYIIGLQTNRRDGNRGTGNPLNPLPKSVASSYPNKQNCLLLFSREAVTGLRQFTPVGIYFCFFTQLLYTINPPAAMRITGQV